MRVPQQLYLGVCANLFLPTPAGVLTPDNARRFVKPLAATELEVRGPPPAAAPLRQVRGAKVTAAMQHDHKLRVKDAEAAKVRYATALAAEKAAAIVQANQNDPWPCTLRSFEQAHADSDAHHEAVSVALAKELHKKTGAAYSRLVFFFVFFFNYDMIFLFLAVSGTRPISK